MMHGWLSEKYFWESCIFVGTKTIAAFDNILNDEIKGIFCNIFILHSGLYYLVWIYFIEVDIETALVEMDLLSGEPPVVYTKEVQFQYIEM